MHLTQNAELLVMQAIEDCDTGNASLSLDRIEAACPGFIDRLMTLTVKSCAQLANDHAADLCYDSSLSQFTYVGEVITKHFGVS